MFKETRLFGRHYQHRTVHRLDGVIQKRTCGRVAPMEGNDGESQERLRTVRVAALANCSPAARARVSASSSRPAWSSDSARSFSASAMLRGSRARSGAFRAQLPGPQPRPMFGPAPAVSFRELSASYSGDPDGVPSRREALPRPPLAVLRRAESWQPRCEGVPPHREHHRVPVSALTLRAIGRPASPVPLAHDDHRERPTEKPAFVRESRRTAARALRRRSRFQSVLGTA